VAAVELGTLAHLAALVAMAVAVMEAILLLLEQPTQAVVVVELITTPATL
jgi:hypothetical protein